MSLPSLARLLPLGKSLRLPTITQISKHLTSNSVPPTIQTPNLFHVNSVPPLTQNNWIWPRQNKIQLPVPNKIQFELPNGMRWVSPLEDPVQSSNTIELPTTANTDQPKEAVRMIIIRRKKMKRHKLKKLRKRMKYEWAKLRQRRELKKEKIFQAELIGQCKEAEAFSAEQYVAAKLAQFNAIGTDTKKEGHTFKKDRR